MVHFLKNYNALYKNFLYLCIDKILNKIANTVKKFLVIIALFLLSSFSAFAQSGNGFSYGARVGINVADYTNSTGTGRSGFNGGAFVDYSVAKIGFELGAYYNQLGSKDVVMQGIEGNKASYNFEYLTAQLLAKYQIYRGFRVFIGPECNFLVNSTLQYGDVVEKRDDIFKFDLGITAGVGYTFDFGLDLSASYTRGLFDMFSSADFKGYNSSFRVSVGWVF